MIKKKDSKIVRRSKAKKNTERVRKSFWEWFFIFITVAFFGVVGYVLLCTPFVTVNDIVVRGTDRVGNEYVTNSAKNAMSGMLFGCIRRDNFFIVQTKRVVEEILKDQRIQTVHVEKKFPHTLVVEVMEYDVVPVWCLGASEGVCYELEQGCVVREINLDAPRFTENDNFVIVDHGHDTAVIGQCVMTQEDLEKIEYLGREFVYTLDVGIVHPYKIDVRGSREVRFETDEGWYILTDLTQETDEVLQVGRLFARKVELLSERKNLEYLDLRFPEKMFYKFKDGVEIDEELSLETDHSLDEEKSKESDADAVSSD